MISLHALGGRVAQYFGMASTGRQVEDPVGSLVELADANRNLHTAIVFAEPPPRAVTLSVEMVLSFLEYPMVRGIVELSHHDLAQGWFAYPTGKSLTLREILNRHADSAQVMGQRAALDVALQTARILAEAAETGEAQGCFSHGALSPWRILLNDEGAVQLLGHGVPSPLHDVGAVRYAPPERIEQTAEDGRSDIYSLAAIACESAVGRPLGSGKDVAALKERILTGELATSVRKAGMPRPIAALLTEAMSTNLEQRPTPGEFATRLERLLQKASPKGPALNDTLNRLGFVLVTPSPSARHRRRQREQALPVVDTAALPFQVIRAAAPAEAPEPAEVETRWSPPTRPAPGAAEIPEPPRRRRRRRRQEDGSVEPVAPPSAAQPPVETPRLRRRRRRSEEAAEPESAPSSEDQPAPVISSIEADGPSAEPEPMETESSVEPTSEPETSAADPVSEPLADTVAAPLADAGADPLAERAEPSVPPEFETPPEPELAGEPELAPDPLSEEEPHLEPLDPTIARRRLTRSGTLSITSRRRRSQPGEEE